ncbi:MAG: PQQ-binding-like beta-propeller repeat protein [Acidobacteria bacterium]|nr:PQQ-binding-like beta-propeller repeat protein [Acidobacteriota bacterium]
MTKTGRATRALRLTVSVLALTMIAATCGDDDSGDQAEPSGQDVDARLECQWPMWGQNIARTFAYPCDSPISGDSVGDLRKIWFVKTADVVSASPVVVDGRLYVGDWTGAFYALDADSGEEFWQTQLSTNPLQYGGQISSSAAFATIDGTDALIVGSGMTVHAIAADDGRELWSHRLGDEGTSTEIISSPIVVGDTVVVTFDAHGAPLPTGMKALSLTTGEQRWYFDPESGDHNGCGGIWGSPTVDIERGLVFAGIANCPTDREGWNENAEALVAVDVETGEQAWSFQPHPPNDRDADFAGAPNLFLGEDDRPLVGLGAKDAHYYAVDRESGELVWDTKATEDGFVRDNFATGGFIGPAAVQDGIIVGATAIGECPCVHAFDAATGEILWQNQSPGPSYAPVSIVNDIAFTSSTTDNQLRAIGLATGEVLWGEDLGVLLSGGVAIVDDDLWAAAGFKEPGTPDLSEKSGVYRFTLDPTVESTITAAPTTTAPDTAAPVRLLGEPNCVDEPCEFTFDIKEPPAGLTPSGTLRIETDPFRAIVETEGLGNPEQWLREGSDAEAAGATAFGLLISERDDNPTGGFLCLFDESGGCIANTVPIPGASYNRMTILAIVDPDTMPDATDGLDRLVETIGFNPPIQTEAIEE